MLSAKVSCRPTAKTDGRNHIGESSAGRNTEEALPPHPETAYDFSDCGGSAALSGRLTLRCDLHLTLRPAFRRPIRFVICTEMIWRVGCRFGTRYRHMPSCGSSVWINNWKSSSLSRHLSCPLVGRMRISMVTEHEIRLAEMLSAGAEVITTKAVATPIEQQVNGGTTWITCTR